MLGVSMSLAFHVYGETCIHKLLLNVTLFNIIQNIRICWFNVKKNFKKTIVVALHKIRKSDPTYIYFFIYIKLFRLHARM